MKRKTLTDGSGRWLDLDAPAPRHRHAPAPGLDRGPYPFIACLMPDGKDCHPAAHGGGVNVEPCRCGAVRRVASTGVGHSKYLVEVGPWPPGGVES